VARSGSNTSRIARLEADQAVEDHVVERSILGAARVVGIYRADVAGRLANAQDAA
jgi:hypothetical protein